MSYYRIYLALLTALFIAAPTRAAVVLFTDPTATHDFVVPDWVTSVRVLAIGGGAGGGSGLLGGGASGYVESGTFAVTGGSVYDVAVGAGGAGVTSLGCGNALCGIGNGGASRFGSLLVARGGSAVSLTDITGNSGGSGGGAACNAGSLGGAGGSGGSAGGRCGSGRTTTPGAGQGDYAAMLADFLGVSAGAGGAGGTGTHAAGGGAGGLLVNGEGPTAGNGSLDWSAKGGAGYGAGGGSGSFDYTQWPMYGMGGAGASGMVLVQYADRDVPAIAFKTGGGAALPSTLGADVAEPASLAILGTGLLLGGLFRPVRRRRT